MVLIRLAGLLAIVAIAYADPPEQSGQNEPSIAHSGHSRALQPSNAFK